MTAYTILTPTGNRNKTFQICREYVRRQTIKPDQWIVVDDGDEPVEGDEFEHIRLLPGTYPTIRRNVLEGLMRVRNDRLIIFEDDDWYASNHSENMLKLLEKGDIAAQGDSIYYNIRARRWFDNKNRCHGSLFQTGFTKEAYSYLAAACEAGTDIYLDKAVWQIVPKKYIEIGKQPTAVGIKGLPGRRGSYYGHFTVNGFEFDPSFVKLKELIGDDYKRYAIFDEPIDPIPEYIEGIRVQRNKNATFSLPRCSVDLEKKLNAAYTRVDRTYRWYCPLNTSMKMDDIAELFKDQIVTIVGKGPSLDDLSQNDFKNQSAPVIAINEAIHKVETLGLASPIFCVQQDAGLKDACRPRKAVLVCSNNCSSHYGDMPRIVFLPEDYGKTIMSLSAEMAIAISKKLGAKGFRMLCFDAATNKKTGYAKCIARPATKGGDVNRFLKHREIIERCAAPFPIEWVTQNDQTNS